MEAALGWIGEIIGWLLSLLPRLYTVDADHEAVVYPAGRRPVRRTAGVHVYWPVVTNEPTLYCVSLRTNLLNAQRLETADGRTVILSLGIRGRVVDVVKAANETEDFDEDINQGALKAAGPVVLAKAFEELRASIVDGSFMTEVARKARSACRPYGYNVEEVFVVDWCVARVFALTSG